MRQPKILTTLKSYNRSLFQADVISGITVAMVALPLSLAIAIASGADPAKGLITAIVARVSDLAAWWQQGSNRRTYGRFHRGRIRHHSGARI